MASHASWSGRHNVPGSIKPVYGAQYPPLAPSNGLSAAPAIAKSTRNAGGGPNLPDPAQMKFHNFEASVSDAWSLDEDGTDGGRGRAANSRNRRPPAPSATSDPTTSVNINSAAAASAAQMVLAHHKHHHHMNEDGGRATNGGAAYPAQHHRQSPPPSTMVVPHPRGTRARETGMQRLAIQKAESPMESSSLSPSPQPGATNLYPRLAAFSASAPSGSSCFLETKGGVASDGSGKSSLDGSAGDSRFEKIKAMLDATNVDMELLRKECWKGIPNKLRPMAWRLLAGYVPSNSDRRESTLKNKRDEYFNFVEQYFYTRHDEQHQDTFRQIHIDIPRMCPLIPFFQQPVVQEMFERILYIWAIRHPASGYVQGINDLVTPFYVVFLSEFIRDGSEVGIYDLNDLAREKRDLVEADSFWCVTHLLDSIQDNYTFAQPGVQRKIKQLEELMERVDNNLHQHVRQNQVEYLQFTFRWMNNLMMREIPLRATIRLWDTYLSEVNGFAHFHVYVCAAFLRIWSKQILQQKDFQNIMLFLQNLPTQSWSDQQICELCADAFSLMSVFAGTKNHLPTKMS